MKNYYLEESLYEGAGQYLEIKKVLVDKITSHQHLKIFDTFSPTHGRAMTLDGILQVTQDGNLPYHEYIATLPTLVHGNVKRVLVIGASDGGVIRQLFRFKTIEKVVMVEIDEEVTDACRRYLPDVSENAFNDERLDLHFMDGRKYVEKISNTFDLIIVDSTDPIGPGAALFKEDFYEKCALLLGKKGILITQNGVPRFQADELKDSIRFMNKLFSYASCYMGDMFDYPGANMALGFASNYNYINDDVLKNVEILEQKLQKYGQAEKLQHLNAETIIAAFALPNYVKKILT